MSQASKLGEVARDWLLQIKEHEQLSPTELSRRAGISQAAMSRLFNGLTEAPSATVLAKLAAISPVAVPPSIRAILDRGGLLTLERNVKTFSPVDPEIPVWGIISVERDGEFHANPLPVTTIGGANITARHGSKLIAFYAHDETMAPRWAMGEPVIVDISRPPTAGNCALIRLSSARDPNGDDVYVFRLYVETRDNRVFFRRIDGSDAQSVPRDRMQIMHRVLDWRDMLN